MPSYDMQSDCRCAKMTKEECFDYVYFRLRTDLLKESHYTALKARDYFSCHESKIDEFTIACLRAIINPHGYDIEVLPSLLQITPGNCSWLVWVVAVDS